MTPVTSAAETVDFQPPGSPRRYILAPLSYRERAAFRADMARMGGTYPSRPQLFAAIRSIVRELAPGNAAELLDLLDAAEADEKGEDTDVQTRLAALEAQIATQPAYAAMAAARTLYRNMLPYVAARHALRGWEGEGLPEFRRDRGLVPDELLEAVPAAELDEVGNKAADLMTPDRAAAGN